VLQVRKVQPDIRARKAALNWVALLAQPAVLALLARKVQWVRPVRKALSVQLIKSVWQSL
jgi:hypothetical protein